MFLFLFQNQRSKSRSNLAEGSPDSSSLGSGSFADGNDHEFSKKSGTITVGPALYYIIVRFVAKCLSVKCRSLFNLDGELVLIHVI